MTQAYRINPEFEKDNKDIYYYAEEATDGAYFHRFIDGHEESSEWAYFKNIEIDEGVLIEVESED